MSEPLCLTRASSQMDQGVKDEPDKGPAQDSVRIGPLGEEAPRERQRRRKDGNRRQQREDGGRIQQRRRRLVFDVHAGVKRQLKSREGEHRALSQPLRPGERVLSAETQ